MLVAVGPRADSESTSSFRALRKLIGQWSPPGFDEIWDHRGKRESKNSEPFWLPSQRAGWTFDDLFVHGSTSQKSFVGQFLPVYRRLVPATGWMWPLGRDVALQWASGEMPARARLRQAPLSAEIGPAGELFMGFMGMYLDVDFAEAAGRAGMRRLATEAFVKDYGPLLKEDSWQGQSIVSLAVALRGLDESEFEALVSLLPEDAPRKAILGSLVLLKSDPEKPIQEVLPAVLDHFWNESLRLTMETVFLDWLRTGISREHRDDQVRHALADDDELKGPSSEPAAGNENDREPDLDALFERLKALDTEEVGSEESLRELRAIQEELERLSDRYEKTPQGRPPGTPRK
jgi:hypothetical protein